MRLAIGLALLAWFWSGRLQAQQDNDLFDQRTRLSREAETIPFHLLDATLETGESGLLWSARASLWYEWTAPADGHFTVVAVPREDQPSRDSGAQKWLFKGDRFNSLEPSFSDLPLPCHRGEVFQIAVSERQESGRPPAGIAGVLKVEFIGAPTNDSPDNPSVLDGDTAETSAWLFAMTPEPERTGEPHAFGWWSWTAPADGWLEVGARGANAIGLFRRGLAGQCIRVTNEPNWLPPVVAGQTYLIGVAGDWAKVSLSLQLVRSLSLTGMPPEPVLPRTSLTFGLEGFADPGEVTQLVWRLDNSDFPTNRVAEFTLQNLAAGNHFLFASAQATSGRRYALRSRWFRLAYPNEDFGAATVLTGETAEFDIDTVSGGLSQEQITLWWRWVAPYSGRLEFLNESHQPVNAIEVWEGDRLENLKAVAGDRVQQGKTYHLRNRYGFKQRLRLELWPVLSANDHLAQASTLPTAGGTLRLDLSDVTSEPEEPPLSQTGQSARRTAWYLYQAEQTGLLMVNLSGSLVRLAVEVFEGDDWGDLQAVLRESGRAMQQHRVRAGRNYRVRVSLPDDQAYPSGVVSFGFGASPENDDPPGATRLEGTSPSFTAHLEHAAGDQWGTEASVWWIWTAPESGWATVQLAPGASPVRRPQFRFFRDGVPTPQNAVTPAAQFGFNGWAYGFPTERGLQYLIRVGSESSTPIPLRLGLSKVRLDLKAGAGWQPSMHGPMTNGFGELWWLERLPEGTREGQPVELRVTGDGPTPSRRLLLAQQVPSLKAQIFQHPGGISPFLARLTNGMNAVYVVQQTEDGLDLFTPPTQIPVQPGNDDLAGAAPLQGTFSGDRFTGTAAGNLQTATLEPGEPALGLPALTRSVWHRWVAGASGEAFVNLRVAGAPRVEVFRGETLAEVQPTSRFGSSADSTIWFPATQGQTYFIRSAVTDWHQRLANNYELSLQQQMVSWVALPPEGAIENGAYRLEVASALPSAELVKCEFLVNDVLVHEIINAPWAWEWSPGRPGGFALGARMHLRSGEILHLAPQPATVRPANLSPATAAEVSGRAPVLAVALSPRGFGTTNSAWFRWIAPADGIVATRTPTRAFREVPGGAWSELPLHLPERTLPWSRFQVEAGRAYLFSVVDSGEHELHLLPPVLNDDFEQAAVLTGTRLELVSIPWLASGQPGEPMNAAGGETFSQWWKWTAPEDGYYEGGADIFQGDRLDQLRRPPFGSGIRVTNGVTYHLVTTYQNSLFNVPFGPRTNVVTLLPLVPNDHFANRLALTGRRVRFGAELDRATEEPGEPLIATFGRPGQTAWWTWVAPVTGPVLLRTVSSSASVQLGAFSGSSISELARLGSGEIDQVRFEAQAGQAYQIVASTTNGRGTSFEAEVISEAPPANDRFDSRSLVTNATGLASGWNFGARREWGEPLHGGDFGGRSVWYRWRAEASGNARVILAGELLTPLLGIYTGSVVDQLQPVPVHDGASPEFTAHAGQEYAIAVDGWLGATGDFTLRIAVESDSDVPILQIGLVDSQPALHFAGHPELPLRLESTPDLHTWLPEKRFPPSAESQIFIIPAVDSERWFRLVVD